MANPGVIQEGGLGGHMNHLYDSPDLSFGEMKQIFQLAASGELEGTQKVDGQNIFLSYSLAKGHAIAARNKSHLKSGGMNAQELADFFKGRDALQKAFVDGFQAFGEAVSSFSDEEIVGAFGQDGEIYYSAEVIEPANANVIDYDEQVLNIHRTGHGEVERETGNVVASDRDPKMQKSSAILDAAISKVENAKQSNNFRVQRGSIEKLQFVLDGKHAQEAISRLDAIVGGDAETIGEFVVKKLKPLIRQKADLPKDKQSMLIQKMLGSKGLNKRVIKKGLPEKDQMAVEEFLSQAPSILKSIIKPIEMVVHDFAVDALQGMQSIFMLGAQEPKVEKLRDKVAAEIQAIQASGNEASMSKLKSQLEKMKYAEKGLEGITTAAEGFVFDFNGKTYKLTGNYAPINQILGILRYKRSGKEEVNESKIIKEQEPTPPYHGDRDDKLIDQTSEYALWQITYGSKKYWLITDHNGEMVEEHGTGFGKKRDAMSAWAKFTDADEFKDADEWEEQDPSERYLVGKTTIMKEKKGQGIALVPGGFKPPHGGHYEMVRWAATQPGVDRTIVLVSPKGRGTVGVEESIAIWNIYKSLGGDFDVQQSGIASPVGAAYEYVDRSAQAGQTIYVVKGEKDSGDKRFGAMQGRKEGVEVKELNAPTMAGGMSGTQMRGYITKGDVRGFQNALPPLSQENKNKVWEIVSGGTALQEYLERVVYEVLDEVAKSKSQQRFMGMVKNCQDTGDCPSEKVAKAAKSMSSKDAKDYASTKHKGLPEKVDEDAIKAFGNVAIAAMDGEGLKQTINQVFQNANMGRGPVTEEEELEEWLKPETGDYEQDLVSSVGQNIDNEVKPKAPIDEVSAAGGGAAEGGPAGAWSNFNPEENENEKPGER